GTPEPAPDDAARTLRCALAMIDAVERWNVERQAAGEPPVRIGIGLDHGPIVLGNIGNERRLEITAIGDAVNVAARLQEHTRSAAVGLAASERFIAAARAAGADAAVKRLEAGPYVSLRGRSELVRIWTLGGDDALPSFRPLAGEGAG